MAIWGTCVCPQQYLICMFLQVGHPPFYISPICPKLRTHRTNVWEGAEEMHGAGVAECVP